jgi:hypothetical protein
MAKLDSTVIYGYLQINDDLLVERDAVIEGQLTINQASGTAPLVLTSTTKVDNLNADLLDGQHGSFYQNASNLSTGTVPTARLSGTYNISITGNADTVDNKHATDFAAATHNHDNTYLKLTGGTITGSLTVNNDLTAASNFRVTGTTKADGYFYAGSTSPSNTTRLNYDGYLYATRVYNAVYNDYAECFETAVNYNECKNRIVEIRDDKIFIASPESDLVVGIVSDTYGFVLYGAEDEIKNNTKVPIGVSGTLMVDAENKVSKENIGKFICSGKDGKARVVPKGKIDNYEGKIVGKIIGVNEEINQYKIIICLR